MTLPHADWIVPDWPAPATVRALVTTRAGGVSRGSHASLNLGAGTGDDPAAVAHNRERLRRHLPADPVWLRQVHGIDVIDATAARAASPPSADAAVTRVRHVVCAVLTADCVPVLLASRGGDVVAIAHAGWRGMAAGVIEATVARMGVPAGELIAWLGPAIGPRVYEVGLGGPRRVRPALARGCRRVRSKRERQVPGGPSRACARAALTRGLGRDLGRQSLHLSAIASGSSRTGATRRAVVSRASSGAIDRHLMGTLGYIAAASLIGGLLSIVCAALISFTVRAQWVTVLVSFAIGALLGAAFLEVLPHAFGNAEDLRAVSATVLAGILAFFVLEKLVLWRHFHGDECEGHDHHTDGSDHGRSGADDPRRRQLPQFRRRRADRRRFLESIPLGVVAAIAIIAHEIPQEVGRLPDPAPLRLQQGARVRAEPAVQPRNGGRRRGAATSRCRRLRAGSTPLLALAGASMIYVAVADLIPSLHKRPELRATVAAGAHLSGLAWPPSGWSGDSPTRVEGAAGGRGERGRRRPKTYRKIASGPTP